MTIITIDRALLEQALELIESEYVHLPEDAAYKLMQSIRAELAKNATPAWPTMPPSKGQSPVLFEDGYTEGWAKCIDMCEKAGISPTAIQQVTPDVAALKAQRGELAKDAERYRWLRDVWVVYKPAGYDGRNACRFDFVLDCQTNDLDATIDAAIAKAEGKEDKKS